jgi:hypothetical protein
MWTRYGRINRATYFLCLAIIVGGYGLLIHFMTKPPHIAELLAALIATRACMTSEDPRGGLEPLLRRS